MSKTENITSNQKDIYSIWRSDVDNFYSNMEKSIPQFHQAFTNLFQEYAKSWNNFAISAIDIQRDYATKAGIKPNLSEATLGVLHDSTEKINKSFNVQTKMSIASIDATKHNIKTWNENSSAFANLSPNILDSLMASINPKI